MKAKSISCEERRQAYRYDTNTLAQLGRSFKVRPQNASHAQLSHQTGALGSLWLKHRLNTFTHWG